MREKGTFGGMWEIPKEFGGGVGKIVGGWHR